MPSLGADMEAGTVLRWYVKPGDVVHRGDLVARVDTSKADIDIEVFEDGVVDELLVAEGARVPVGAPLALLRGAGALQPAVAGAPAEGAPDGRVPGAPVPEGRAPEGRVPEAPVPEGRAPVGRVPEGRVPEGPVPEAPAPATPPPAVAGPAPALAPAPTAAPRTRVSPLARRVAASLGVDLARVQGTGPNGAIVRADVERAAAPAPGPGPAAPAPPGTRGGARRWPGRSRRS
jgi:pyruvate dehydrogenase E2 component (dihydrolipoamide acetyltransferase)